MYPPPPQIDEGRLGVKDAPDTERQDIIVRPGHGRKADGIWRELLMDAVCALPAVPSTLALWRVHTSVIPALAAGISPSSAGCLCAPPHVISALFRHSCTGMTEEGECGLVAAAHGVSPPT